MKRSSALVAFFVVFAAVISLSIETVPSASDRFMTAPTQGDPGLKSVGPLAFGPQGLLLIAEPSAAAIVAVDTGDFGVMTELAHPIVDVASLLAGALKTTADQLQIVGMAVNPQGGKVYFSVRNNAAKSADIVVVNTDGTAKKLDMSAMKTVRVTLPKSEAGPIRNISDVAFTDQQVLITGQSNEEFSSKIFSIPLPLSAHAGGEIFSAETYHVSHRRWETKAPIQSFIPFNDHGTPCVLGAFACTPIAKFPLKDIRSGANIRGTSVVELGSGNRPLDLFAYSDKDGAQWIVCNTLRFHQPLFGPSKYWGVRMSAALLASNAPEQINEKAARRNVKADKGPEGIEVMASLQGAVHIDKLSDTSMVVLRESGDKLKLEAVPLP